MIFPPWCQGGKYHLGPLVVWGQLPSGASRVVDLGLMDDEVTELDLSRADLTIVEPHYSLFVFKGLEELFRSFLVDQVQVGLKSFRCHLVKILHPDGWKDYLGWQHYLCDISQAEKGLAQTSLGGSLRCLKYAWEFIDPSAL